MAGFEPANSKRAPLKGDAFDRLATYVQKGPPYWTRGIV